ncbi:ABC transporter permease [Gordonia sp. CPCC 206044]|uniref:ABC transporter permease n=1 Tax=Gordonia sp. CPCC 206044 TaxID=3140793 RepID=UPI003AF3C004
MFVALRELRRSWRRFGLVGVVVVLVAVLSTIVVGLSDGLVQQGTSGLRDLPLDHLAFAPHAQATFSRSTVDDTQLEKWRDHAEASPLGVSFVNASSDAGAHESIDLALFGVTADSFLVERDDARAALAGPPGLVLSHAFEEKGIRVGDRFSIGGGGVTLPVLGFTFAGSYGHVDLAFTSLSTWQQITYGTDANGRFSAVALRVPPGTDVAAIDRSAGTDTLTKTDAYAGSPGYSAETQTMTMIRVFLLVISALIVGAFFTVLTLQRVRQIGVLKAMGASSWYVIRDGLAQIAIVVVAATVVGTALGAAVIVAMSGGAVPVQFSGGSVVTSAVILAIAGIVGGAVTLRRISRIEPSIALGAEA